MPRYCVYTEEELELLHDEFERYTPLSNLAIKLNRTPYGLARKILRLSEELPGIWDPEKAQEYFRQVDLQAYHTCQEKKNEQRRQRYSDMHGGNVRHWRKYMPGYVAVETKGQRHYQRHKLEVKKKQAERRRLRELLSKSPKRLRGLTLFLYTHHAFEPISLRKH
jgi:hypothetical protein